MTLRIFHALEYVDSSRTKCTPKADPWHLCDIVCGWRVWLSVCVRPCDATRYGLNWIANITETIHDSAKPQSQNQNGLMDWKKFNWNRHSYEIYSCFSSYIYFFSFLFSFYYWNEGILMNISKERSIQRDSSMRFFTPAHFGWTFWNYSLLLLCIEIDITKKIAETSRSFGKLVQIFEHVSFRWHLSPN